MTNGAEVASQTGEYRFRLTRAWLPAGDRVCFIMLNPSVADAERDDPTLRRCIGFARSWGFASLCVVNLFALRSTNPSLLRSHADPVGPGNDRHIIDEASSADLIVAAWGNWGRVQARDEAVLELLRPVGDVHAIRLNKSQRPAHPLMLPGSLRPELFQLRRPGARL